MMAFFGEGRLNKFFLKRWALAVAWPFCAACGPALLASPGAADGNKLLALLERKPPVESFANSAFLDVDPTYCSIAASKNTVARLLHGYRKIQRISSMSEARAMTTGTLSLPKEFPTRILERIVRSAKDHGVATIEEMIHAEGVMVLEGQILFWRLLSDTSLVVLTSEDELCLLQL